MLYYIVYSKKVARELERQGFVVQKVEPNKKYLDKKIIKYIKNHILTSLYNYLLIFSIK